MKVPHIILAVYVFLSALYPCTDSDLSVDPIRNAVAVVTDHDHSHSGNEIDICTPFCICSCCAAHIQLSDLNDIEVTKPVHNTVLITHYIEHPVLNISSSIWQPPRG